MVQGSLFSGRDVNGGVIDVFMIRRALLVVYPLTWFARDTADDGVARGALRTH